MNERLIVYVDGFNLYHGMHQRFQRRYLWLDLVALATALRPRSKLVAVRYFTASVLDDPPAQSRQDTYHNALRAAYPELLEIVMGRYTSKPFACRNCGATHTRYEEKETDVNIAVRLVADAAQDSADSFLIVSADSDVAPAVRLAQQIRPRAFITAAFPPSRASAQLRALMPASFTIGRDKLAQSQLPDPVIDNNGTEYRRPEKWQ